MKTVRALRGFTLVELMIVIAIIGVLAALAIVGVSRYLRHSKTAEPTRALARMEAGSAIQFQNETPFGFDPSNATVFVHLFCPNAPAAPSAVPNGAKVSIPPATWKAPGWSCLDFSLDAPVFYQYQYATNGLDGVAGDYTALALGDLNGDGIQSRFELQGVGGFGGDAIRRSLNVLNEDE